MNILLMGLGNPGSKYQLNRHNAGFTFLDWVLSENKDTASAWKFDKYSDSEIAKILLTTNDQKLTTVLAKPQTFMNRSGRSVHKLMSASNLEQPTLIVVHDDLDIRLGNFKIQKGVGPKVHNGLESIESSLKTKDFWRIRIGIDNRDSDYEGSGEGYVLSNFEKDEEKLLQSIFPAILQRLLQTIS